MLTASHLTQQQVCIDRGTKLFDNDLYLIRAKSILKKFTNDMIISVEDHSEYVIEF